MSMKRQLSVFDFDGTITYGDSFVTFIRHVFGLMPMLAGLMLYAPPSTPPPTPLCIVQLSCTGLSHGGGVVLRMSPNHIQVDFRDHHFLFPNCTFVVLRRFASLPASPPPPARARAPTLGVESELHLLA